MIKVKKRKILLLEGEGIILKGVGEVEKAPPVPEGVVKEVPTRPPPAAPPPIPPKPPIKPAAAKPAPVAKISPRPVSFCSLCQITAGDICPEAACKSPN